MFNEKNPTEMNIVRILAHGEGIITQEDFISVTNKTMFSRYKSQGYLVKAKNAAPGTYQITGKFKRDFCRQIEPQHKFSGSGSPTHARGLNRAIHLLPTGAKLTTGQELKQDFEKFRKTATYHQALAEIQKRTLAELQKVEAQAAADKSRNYTYELRAARSSYELACDSRGACSSPDLAATMSHQDLEDFRGELCNYYLNNDMSKNKLYLLHQAITKLQHLENTTKGEVTVHIEIVTGSYGSVEIEQKENYEETTGSFLILLPA